MTNSKTRVLVESPKLCLGYVVAGAAGLNLDKWPVGKTVCWSVGWPVVIWDGAVSSHRKTIISDEQLPWIRRRLSI